MFININTPIDDVLREWAKLSYKFFHSQLITKEDLQRFRQINNILDVKGATDIYIFSINNEKCTLCYNRQGGYYRKDFDIIE